MPSDLGKFDVFKIDGNTCYNTAAKNGWCYTDKVSKLIVLVTCRNRVAVCNFDFFSDPVQGELGLLHALLQLGGGDHAGRARGK